MIMENLLLFIVLIFANVLWTFLTIAIVALAEDIVSHKKEAKEEIEPNNLIEFVWEDEDWNWLYRFK